MSRDLREIMADLAAAGLAPGQMALVLELTAAVGCRSEIRTPRQDRNARYYQNKKDRLNTSESKTPKTVSDAKRLNSDSNRDAPKKESPHTPIENTSSSEPRGSSEGASAPQYADDKHELWGEGPPILIGLGVPSRQTRSLLGRWMRDLRDDARSLLEILRRARVEKPQEPIGWITRAIPAQSRGPPMRGGGFAQVLLEKHQERTNGNGDFDEVQPRNYRAAS